MGNDGGIARPVSHVDGFQRLRQCPDLIDLNEDGVCNALINALRQALRIGDKEIVAYQLHLTSDGFRQHGPAFPIRFTHSIFKGDNRVFLRKPLPHCYHLPAVQALS